jgi:hypothetical protein
MARLRDAPLILGSLESGDLMAEVGKTLTEAMQQLDDITGRRPKAKAKSHVTLKLVIEVENGTTNITAEITSKVPKPPRPSTFFWLLADGTLSTDHPKQIDMFKPRDTSAREVDAVVNN